MSVKKKIWGSVILLLMAFSISGVIYVVGTDIFEWLYPSENQIVFFDVGQGDSILLRTAEGANILIDGGPDNTVLFALSEYIPFYDKEIDLLVLTHPDADHVTGLVEVLRRYEVKRVLATGVVHALPAHIAFWNEIKKQQIPVVQPIDKQVFMYDELELEVLWPEERLWQENSEQELNDTSIVLRAEFQDQYAVLLPGDATLDVELVLAEELGRALQSDILKLGHHGSKTSSHPDFVKAVSPELAVVSAGRDNPYGHPHHRVVRVFELLNIPLYHTSESDVQLLLRDNEWQVQ